MDLYQPWRRCLPRLLRLAAPGLLFSSGWPRQSAQESAWDLRRHSLMTALGGLGHTLPFLIPAFRVAMIVAFGVVLVELATITWIRHRYMDTPTVSAALQVGLGGVLVFITGVLIGSS